MGRNRRTAAFWPAAFVLLLSTLGFASCASGPPEILGAEWTLEERPAQNADSPGPRWSLSVFARVHDPDGIDDLEGLWVVNDRSELSWSIDASSWTKKRLGNDDWIGAGGLRMPDGSGLPAGMYRVIVADLAGNRASYEFKLEIPDQPKAPPTATWDGARVGLSSQWQENYLLAYDASGSLIRTAVLPAGGAILAVLVGSVDLPRTRAFAVYGYDQASRCGAFSRRTTIQ